MGWRYSNIRKQLREEIKEMSAWEKAKYTVYALGIVFILTVNVLYVMGETPQQKGEMRCQEQYGNESLYSSGECYNMTDMEVIAKDYVYRHRPRSIESREIGRFMDISSVTVEEFMGDVSERNCHYTMISGGWFKANQYTFVSECANRSDPIW